MSEEGRGTPLLVVYDCMVFLQGLVRESGPAVACLELFEREEVELLVSNDVLLEIKDVLTRPKLLSKSPRLTEERVGTLIKTLLKKARFVGFVPRQFEYQRDPKDERYINLALAAEATYLVSRDHDLLDLMDEQKPGAGHLPRSILRSRFSIR